MDLLPKKTIPYPDVRFKTETFRRAREKMLSEARSEEPQAPLSVYFVVRAKNDQEKTYNDQEEFFAEYRAGQFKTTYASWSVAGRYLVSDIEL